MAAFDGRSTIIKVVILTLIIFFVCELSLSYSEEVVAIDKRFNGREIKVVAGNMIRIELEQAGATGYTWEINNLDTKHFEVVSAKTPEPPEKTEIVGAPVKKTWFIRTKEKGKSELKFNLFRPWEGQEKSADTFVVKVRIL